MKIVRDKNDPMYQERRKLALKAFEGGFVLFSTDTKKWYTPREFIESEEQVRLTSYDVREISNIVLHYPKNAIMVESEKILKVQQEFNEFLKKIHNAFELHPVDKKKK